MREGEELYGHGMVWNRDLPGLLGQLKLGFDLRVNLETGIGFGTAEDPVHPEWNLHFAIHEARHEKRPKGDATAIAIRVGEHVFAGAGLVVIAIIAILMAMLVPAVQ